MSSQEHADFQFGSATALAAYFSTPTPSARRQALVRPSPAAFDDSEDSESESEAALPFSNCAQYYDPGNPPHGRSRPTRPPPTPTPSRSKRFRPQSPSSEPESLVSRFAAHDEDWVVPWTAKDVRYRASKTPRTDHRSSGQSAPTRSPTNAFVDARSCKSYSFGCLVFVTGSATDYESRGKPRRQPQGSSIRTSLCSAVGIRRLGQRVRI